MKAAIRDRPGIIAYEDTRLATKPWLLQGETWSLPITSVILRTISGDGVIAPPRGYAGLLPYALAEMPDLGRLSLARMIQGLRLSAIQLAPSRRTGKR